ncbi:MULTISPECIES: GNAT family N-acetyltransferase [unclassified Microbacterium]|uniref:GNAT family N-acetyltransferase n=1 Tax=Microbacterium TaxID=33882 RepID=UPI003B9EBB3D
MEMLIRRPLPADAPALARLHVLTWRETYGHLLPSDFFGDAHLEMRQTMWERILANPRPEWTVLTAALGDELVGFVSAGPGSESGTDSSSRQLYTLYVRSRWHGAGIGQALFDAAVGHDACVLWVAKENPRAIAFYRKNGFEFDGQEQADDAVPGIVEARMRRASRDATG